MSEERLFDPGRPNPRWLSLGAPDCEHSWTQHWRAGAMGPYAASCPDCGAYALTSSEVERLEAGKPERGAASTAFGSLRLYRY
jgi:hypothetical protein